MPSGFSFVASRSDRSFSDNLLSLLRAALHLLSSLASSSSVVSSFVFLAAGDGSRDDAAESSLSSSSESDSAITGGVDFLFFLPLPTGDGVGFFPGEGDSSII
jgi:hypothetical protein